MSAAPALPAGPSSDPQPERDALERILRSEILDRAPNLISFLRFVCEMQISGRTEAIKEYNIAVEALGRPADFDQKKDSIVRVEAHRLRKRLADYYRTAGLNDPVEIVLPAGSYVPVFRPRGSPSVPADAVATPEDNADALPATVEAPPVPLPRALSGRWWISGGVLAIVAIAFAFATLRKPEPVVATVPAVQRTAASLPAAFAQDDDAIRIVCGGQKSSFADAAGNFWYSDRYFTGGEIATATPRPIRRTPDQSLYLTRRQGEFDYLIPVRPGKYEVRLHFAETVFGEDNVAGGGESSRVFHIRMNGGEPWLADIVSDAGGSNTADIRVYRGVEPGPDGTIRISFLPTRKEAPFVNAIEVLPSPDGRMLPVRIVARDSSLIGSAGEEWLGDRFFLGGQYVLRHEPLAGPEKPELFQGERYGNFTYAIPVAEGSQYTLTLRFAESWFGEGRPGGGGAGSRVFDVYCNGRALLRNFDIHREAGGPMRQLKKVFRNLEPNAQGKLFLQFVPVVNYAMVNAIEVIDQGR